MLSLHEILQVKTIETYWVTTKNFSKTFLPMNSKNIIDFIMTSFYIIFCPNTFALYFRLKQGNNIK